MLDRDAVTTGLIFQKDIPWETRMQIYKFGIENLRKLGKIIYVKVDSDKVTVKNILGEAKEFKGCKIIEVDVPNARLILSEA